MPTEAPEAQSLFTNLYKCDLPQIKPDPKTILANLINCTSSHKHSSFRYDAITRRSKFLFFLDNEELLKTNDDKTSVLVSQLKTSTSLTWLLQKQQVAVSEEQAGNFDMIRSEKLLKIQLVLLKQQLVDFETEAPENLSFGE